MVYSPKFIFLMSIMAICLQLRSKQNNQIMKKGFLLLFAMMMLFAQHLLAQGLTTGSISGKITDNKALGLPGATIIAIHQPSGTKYATSTQKDGRFNLPSVRIGGPYTISVSSIGFTTETITDAKVGLGENLSINIAMKDQSSQLQKLP
jgi:hypothetical protein